MKLSFNILYYNLSRENNIQCIHKNKKNILVGPPIYYDTTLDCSGHIVIIQPIDLEFLSQKKVQLNDVIFICMGELSSRYTLPNDLLVCNDTQSSNHKFNLLQHIFSIYDRWEDEMKAIYYENRSYSEFINCCDSIIKTPLALSDIKWSYVAYSTNIKSQMWPCKMIDKRNYLPFDRVNELISHPDYAKVSNIKKVFKFTTMDCTTIHKNIFYENKYVGRLCALYNEDYVENEYNKNIIDILSQYVEKMYARNGAFYPKEIAMNELHSLIEDCLNKKIIHIDKWNHVLTKKGWSREDSYQLVKLQPNHRNDKGMYAEYLCPEIEVHWNGCCCLEFNEKILIFINLTIFNLSKNDFHHELVYFLKESLLIAGISRNFHDPIDLSAALKQSEIALEFGLKKNPTSWYFRFNDYALDYLLLRGISDFTPEQICSEKLLMLKEHDNKKNTSFYYTLLTYFQTDYNAAATAKKLFIQRSSFLNRMNRIIELTQLDMDLWKMKTYLTISFQLIEELSDN